MVAERLIEAGYGPRKQAIKRGEYPSVPVEPTGYPDEESSLRKYMTDVSKYPLLSPGRTWICFHRIALFKQLPLNTDPVVSETASVKADKARQRLILRNQRLAFSVAWKLPCPEYMTIADAIQECNIGLIAAVESFDYRMGFRFSTYAVKVIRDKAIKAIWDKDSIREPQYIHEITGNVFDFIERFEQQHGRTPSLQEIVAEIVAIEPGNKGHINYARAVANILAWDNTRLVSLQSPLGEDDGRTPEDVIADPNIVSPEEAVLRTEIREEIDEFLGKHLTDEGKKVVALYAGLNGPRLGQTEIGTITGKSRQAVNGILNTSRGRLKRALEKSSRLS